MPLKCQIIKTKQKQNLGRLYDKKKHICFVMENIKSEGPLTFNTRINSTSFHSTNAFLNLHLQVIPYANLEGKNLFLFLLRISMYSDTHFDGARYYVQGEAPLLSCSGRREARATGPCCDEGLRLSSSCHNKLIPPH